MAVALALAVAVAEAVRRLCGGCAEAVRRLCGGGYCGSRAAADSVRMGRAGRGAPWRRDLPQVQTS